MNTGKSKQTASYLLLALLLAGLFHGCVSRDFTRMQESLMEGRLEDALAASRRASRDSKKDPIVIGLTRALTAEVSLVRLGEAQELLSDKRYNAARDAARKALEANPGNRQGCSFMADVCCLDGIKHYSSNDYEEALNAFGEARKYCPRHPVAKKYAAVSKRAWSCREYEAAMKESAKNTKSSLKKATALFESAEKRTPGFYDAAARAKECRKRFALICFAEAKYMLTSGKQEFSPALGLFLMEEGAAFCPSFKRDKLFKDAKAIVKDLAKVNFSFDVHGDTRSGYVEKLRKRLAAGIPGFELANSTCLPGPLFDRRWKSTVGKINELLVSHGANSELVLDPPAVEISVKLEEPRIETVESGAKSVTSRYLHGSKQVSNPRKKELASKIPRVANKLNHLRNVEYPKQVAAEQAQRAAKRHVGFIGGLVVGAVTKSLLDEVLGDIESTEAELRVLQNEYDSAPDLVTVKDIRSYSYRKSTVTKKATFRAAVTISDPEGYLRESFKLEKTCSDSDTRIKNAHGKDVEGIVDREPRLRGDRAANDEAFKLIDDEFCRAVGGELATYHNRWLKKKGLESKCMNRYLSRQAGNKIKGSRDSGSNRIVQELMAQLIPANSYPTFEKLLLPKSWSSPEPISRSVSQNLLERYTLSVSSVSKSNGQLAQKK